MKLVILAGGYGTRLAEETKIKPKPLVKIGKKPIIWHLMKIYSFYGIKDFIICLGYKGELLKFKEPAVCFKINVLFNTWTKNMSENELYEIIRGNWTVNIKKAKSVKYALGISDNLVRGIYKINSWRQVYIGRKGEKYKRPRWRFTGKPASEMDSKVGCLITNFKNHRVSGPIFYINI